MVHEERFNSTYLPYKKRQSGDSDSQRDMKYSGNCRPGDGLSCHTSEPDMSNDSCVCHRGDVRKCKPMAIISIAGLYMKQCSETDVGFVMENI